MNTAREIPTASAPSPEADAATTQLAVSYQRLTVGSRSFRLASYFLPADVRDDAARVYSFCRLVDDIADDSPSPELARDGLALVQNGLRQSSPTDPIVGAYAEVARRCAIDHRIPEELITGVLSDQYPVRVQSDADLLLYAYRVASTVGLMMCGVLGVRDPRALSHAVDLGMAMQITNICRDVLEDGRLGRCYLPANRLTNAGTSTDAILDGDAPVPAVSATVAALLTLADRYYASAEQGMRFIPWRARAAIVVAARVYRAIGVKLRRNGANPMNGRTVLSGVHRVAVAAVAMLRFFRPSIQGWTTYRGHDADLHRQLPAALPGIHRPATSTTADP